MKKLLMVALLVALCSMAFARSHQVYTVLYPQSYKILNVTTAYVSWGYLKPNFVILCVHYQRAKETIDIVQYVTLGEWDRSQDPIVTFEATEDVRDFEVRAQIALQLND